VREVGAVATPGGRRFIELENWPFRLMESCRDKRIAACEKRSPTALPRALRLAIRPLFPAPERPRCLSESPLFAHHGAGPVKCWVDPRKLAVA